MNYQVILKSSAEKELNNLRGSIFHRVTQKLLSLESDPRPHGSQKLHGQEAYRIRIGDYRMLYLIDDSARRIEIISVAHRREAYR